MARPERALDAANGPIAAFAHDLRVLRQRAGTPSYRELARTALFAPSVLSSAASGHRLPTLAVTLAFVRACGGDAEAWARRWHSLAGQVSDEDDPGSATPRKQGRGTAAGTLSEGERVSAGPPPPRPAQLPPALTTFVGREEALQEAQRLTELHGAARMPLHVTGALGTGKAAFALRLAESVAPHYPDGQLYADLGDPAHGPRSADVVVRGFLRALGVPAALIPEDPGQCTGLYRSLLAHRRLFVLLAGARDESQVRPLLGQAERSQVVVTSRTRLLGLDGVRRIELGGLRREESLHLLARLVGRDRLETEPAAAAAIAESCDDLPLAVHVIGRRIATTPGWTLAYLADQLADRRRRLELLRIGDVSVRNRLAAAYRPLSPAARRVVDEIAADGADWITSVGVAVALDLQVENAEALLEQLVDAGLLRAATRTGRYRVPGLVKAFTADPVQPLPAVVSDPLRRIEPSIPGRIRPRGRAAALVVRMPTSFRSIRPLR